MTKRSILKSFVGLFAAQEAVQAEAAQPLIKLDPWPSDKDAQAVCGTDASTTVKSKLLDAITGLSAENITAKFNYCCPHTGRRGVMVVKHRWVGDYKWWKSECLIMESDPETILSVLPRAVKYITEQSDMMSKFYAENPWTKERDRY